MAEELVAQVGEHALARPAGQVGVRGGEPEREERDAEEESDDLRQPAEVAGLMPSSIASFARYGGASATSV